jgi:hypothetical protein
MLHRLNDVHWSWLQFLSQRWEFLGNECMVFHCPMRACATPRSNLLMHQTIRVTVKFLHPMVQLRASVDGGHLGLSFAPVFWS